MTQSERQLRRRQEAIEAELDRRVAAGALDIDESQAERLRGVVGSGHPAVGTGSVSHTQAEAIRSRQRRR